MDFAKIGSVNAINDEKKVQPQQPQQNQVAFINTIWEGFGSSQGTEASFNA